MQLTDKITITNEDNMLLMARYPDNYFDLAIVDPPYGLGDSVVNSGVDLKDIIIKMVIGIMQYQVMNILKNYFVLVKIKLFGVEIILIYLKINVLLFGINKTRRCKFCNV
jgi:DNA modification methylase